MLLKYDRIKLHHVYKNNEINHLMFERYEREVNQGHRSAIKRILEGDAPPSMLLVLCVSAIRSNYKSRSQACSSSTNGSDYGEGAKVELTDGWYGTDPIDLSLPI